MILRYWLQAESNLAQCCTFMETLSASKESPFLPCLLQPHSLLVASRVATFWCRQGYVTFNKVYFQWKNFHFISCRIHRCRDLSDIVLAIFVCVPADCILSLVCFQTLIGLPTLGQASLISSLQSGMKARCGVWETHLAWKAS